MIWHIFRKDLRLLWPLALIVTAVHLLNAGLLAYGHQFSRLSMSGLSDYGWLSNNALPLLMGHFYPPGMLGLGLTALLASFMSGMAGNTTAFNTVFTFDLYQAYLVKGKPDHHYLNVGRIATVAGVLISVAAKVPPMTSTIPCSFRKIWSKLPPENANQRSPAPTA